MKGLCAAFVLVLCDAEWFSVQGVMNENRSAAVFRLADEEHFAVFGQRPQLIINDELQFVHVVTDALEQACHCIVIGDGLVALAGELVGHLACVHQFLHILGDEAAVLAYLLNEYHVVGTHFLGDGRREDFLHLVYVVDELALITCGHRDDVVEAEVAEDACLYLYLLGVSLLLDLQSCFQFGL